MESELIRSHPATMAAAKAQVPWALKLLAKGWSSLNTNQKRAARNATGIIRNMQVFTPARPRVRAPLPQDRKNVGQAGKSMTITRTEYLTDVVATAGATPVFTSWVVNPRNARCFPQTSIMALNFNKYRMVRLAIRYAPACSFETNGRVAMGWNDDASDSVPTNKMQLYNLRKHGETAAQTALTIEIPMDNKVRFMHDSTSDDPKLVDLGRVVLTTFGFESSITAGELFLEYTVVFSDPTYTAKISQDGTASASDGPSYASVQGTATKSTITIHNPGKWIVILRTKSGQLGKPTLAPSGMTGEVYYSSDADDAIAVCVVETQLPDLDISTTTAVTNLARWFVTRQ